MCIVYTVYIYVKRHIEIYYHRNPPPGTIPPSPPPGIRASLFLTPPVPYGLAYTRYCFVSGVVCTNQYHSLRTHPLFGTPHPHHRLHYCAI